MQEMRMYVCKDCIYNRDIDIDDCAIYELCSIDYIRSTCDKKVVK